MKIDDILPICFDPSATDKKFWRINLAGMTKHSPTSKEWGYMPFLPTYTTEVEAKQVRKEIYKVMKEVFDPEWNRKQ